MKKVVPVMILMLLLCNVTSYPQSGIDSAFSSLHDVAITNVTPPSCTIIAIYPPPPLTVSVAVENQGDYPETFNVTAYIGTDSIGTQNVSLTSEASTTLTFNIPALNIFYLLYTISANATIVPGETDIADNTYIDGTILLSIPGDITADGEVNILDIATVAVAFGTESGDQKWNGNADINNDGIVNIVDIRTIAKEFGET